MTKKENAKLAKSQRAQQHKEMYKDVMSRPGIYDAMRAYDIWEEKDRGLDPYRLATRKTYNVSVTNTLNEK